MLAATIISSIGAIAIGLLLIFGVKVTPEFAADVVHFIGLFIILVTIVADILLMRNVYGIIG